MAELSQENQERPLEEERPEEVDRTPPVPLSDEEMAVPGPAPYPQFEQPAMIAGEGNIEVSESRGDVVVGSVDPDALPQMVGTDKGTAVCPYEVEPTNFETETVQDDNWNRNFPPNCECEGATTCDGVAVRVQMRTAFNHLGQPPKLYAFYRTFVFDSHGLLKIISSETRVTVDSPVDCTV